jgi:ATP-binding cassette, subfamily C (CFTR/MRP), member 1
MSAEGFSGGATELQEYDQSTASFSAPLVSFINADISWSPDTQVVLHNLNMNITQGITVLIGPVGSGKSTVLESILGQTYVKRGSLNSTLTKVAYCCQTPWIIDGTIQDNITGGAEFDDSWYQFTISACGLEEDMRAFTKNNTAKRTGNKGALLSGGQKQRVVSSIF